MSRPTTSPAQAFADAVAADRLAALATVIRGPGLGRKRFVPLHGEPLGTLGDPELDRTVLDAAREALAAQQPRRLTLQGDTEVFIDVHVPRPTLIIVGAVHIAIPLVTFAKTLGFRTVVVDARSAFATPERFAHADELIIRWPADVLAEMALDETTYVVTLTHDEKLDNPALVEALRRPVRYIGALGSRRTHARRVEALRAQGVSQEQIACIHAPIGLDLGGRSPEEIALAIMAEIVAVRNRGPGGKP